jgi:hypothetical protein
MWIFQIIIWKKKATKNNVIPQSRIVIVSEYPDEDGEKWMNKSDLH